MYIPVNGQDSEDVIARTLELEADLTSFQPDTGRCPDDVLGVAVCNLAIMAIRERNYGVGCLLLDPSGTVIEQGRNQVFHPYFRSDRHAEMVVLNSFEDHNPEVVRLRDYTLFASLEPCPMCVSRIVMSGVGKTKYLAKDPGGGMADAVEELPQNFVRLSQQKLLVRADCSPRRAALAWDIFMLNRDELRAKLMQR